MPRKQVNKSKKVYTPTCVHTCVKTDGVIKCVQCDMKAILYLTPQPKPLVIYNI